MVNNLSRLFFLGLSLILFLLISFSICFYSGGFSSEINAKEDNKVSKTIEVSGDAVVYVEPDEATFRVGVRTVSDDAEGASRENAEKMDNIKEYLINAGIREDDISTAGYRISTRTRRTDDEVKVIGYEVRNSLNIETSDIEGVGRYIDIAVNNGANDVSSIDFGVEDSNEYKNEALQLATEQAYEKANNIAKGFNGTLKEVVHVSESRASYSPIRIDSMDMALEESPEPTTTVETDDVDIKAKVDMIVSFY